MIEHRQAVRRLSDLLSGDLADDRRAELLAHVEECEECREWSETYGFLARSLRGDSVDEHPSSEQLAHLAVDAELLTAPEREQLAAHLETCDDCRQELELSRGALTEARRGAGTAWLPGRWAPPTRAVRLALAASLILALALTFAVLRPGRGGDAQLALAPIPGSPAATVAVPGPSEPAAETPPTLSEPAADMEPPSPSEPAPAPAVKIGPAPQPLAMPATGVAADRNLSGDPLSGDQVIETAGVLTASSVIESGSDITLRAGRMVVLAEGFSIGSTASLGVEIAGQSSGDTDPASHS